MLTHIRAYLEKNPGAKASDIARHLDADKSSVNSLLYGNSDIFLQGDGFQWFLQPSEITIELGDYWLSSRKLEKKLQQYPSPLDCTAQKLIFDVGQCKLMLEAQARLLALCNQLSEAGKTVVLDFKKSANGTLTYLDRIGFFELLANEVQVLPKRPRSGRSKTYRGNNDGVIELHKVDPTVRTRSVTDMLHNSFISCAGSDYDQAVLTIIGELYENVLEHSGTTSHGFAALQFYRSRSHIQVVISDNGKGIIGTLEPLLKPRYSDLAKRIRRSGEHAGIALLKEVFARGSISSKEAERCGGLGLKISCDLAKKYRATITVRQSDFELKIYHTAGGVSYGQWLDLVRIDGTHICFDFHLDASPKASLN